MPESERGTAVQVVSKINNNAILCKDDDGRDVVAFGRGLGFCDLGSQVDLSKVQRTFYDVDAQGMTLLQDIDAEVFSLSSQVIDLVRDVLPYRLSPNIVFVLADHLAFALKRTREGIAVRMPLSFDVEQHFPQEYQIGELVRRRMSRLFDVSLPPSESAGIALCFVNNAYTPAEDEGPTGAGSSGPAFDDLLECSLGIIERTAHISIDRTSFNFSRFATHLLYLYNRIQDRDGLAGDNAVLYATVRDEYPAASESVDRIAEAILSMFKAEISDEEKLYLVLHVNRLCEKACSPLKGDAGSTASDSRTGT